MARKARPFWPFKLGPLPRAMQLKGFGVSRVTNSAFAPNGNLLAAARDDKTLEIRDAIRRQRGSKKEFRNLKGLLL